MGSFEKTIGGESAGVLNFDSQSDLWTDVSVGTVGSNSSRNSENFRNTLNLDNANGGNNGYFGVSKGTIARKSAGAFVRNDSSGLRTDDFVDDIYIDSRKNSGTFQDTLSSDNTNGGNNDDRYLGFFEGTGRCKSDGVVSVSSGLRTNDFVDNIWSNHRRNSEIFGNTLSSGNI